jgi:hypothetical protein
MKVWKLLVVIGAVVVAAALGAVAIAFAGNGGDGGHQRGMTDQRGYGHDGGQGYGWQNDGDQGQNQQGQGQQGQPGQGRQGQDRQGDDWGMGSGMGMGMHGQRGPGSALQSDPELRDKFQDLMTQRRADMQAWWKTYGSDTNSTEAQNALNEIRTKYRNQMQKLLDQLKQQNSDSSGSNGSAGGSNDGTGSGSSTVYQSAGTQVW